MVQSKKTREHLLAEIDALKKKLANAKNKYSHNSRIEKKLKESEEKYRNLFHLSNDGIFIHDLNAKIIEVNKKALKLLGYNKSEILRLTISDLHPKESLNKSKEAFNKIKRDGFVQFEIDFKKKNGQIFSADVSSSIIEMQGKKVVQGIVRDITERKKTEIELKKSQKKLDSIVRSVPDVIYRVNTEARITFISETIRDYGYNPKELIGKSIFTLVHPEDREKAKWHVNERRTGRRRTKSFELRMFPKGHHYVPFDIHAQDVLKDYIFLLEAEGLYSTDKPETKSFLGSQGIARDITNRKLAEIALKESEEKFRSIVENSHVGIGIIDDNFKFTYVNDNFVKITGFSKKELLGQGFQALLDKKNRDFLIEQYIRRQKGEDIPKKYEINIKRKDGEEIVVELLSVVIEDSKGKKRTIVQFLDITERKRSEEVLRRKTYQQEQLLETAKHLTASLNLTEVLTRIAEEAIKMLKAHGCVIYLLEPDNQTLTPVVAIDPKYEKEILSSSINVDNSFTGQAIKAGHGIIFNDAGEDTSGYQIPGTPEAEEEHIIVAPFIVEDKVLGAMCLDQTDVRFSKEDLAITETLATYASTALKNAKAHHTLKIEIEERKQMQQALIESEEKFRNLAEQSPNMIFINCKGKVVYANEKCEEIMGYTREEMYSPDFNFMKLIAPESSHLIKTNLEKHMQDQDLQPYEYTLINRSREKTEALITTKLINYGGKRAILGIITDIGEQKRTEEALKISEEKYRRFFEEDLTGDFIATPDGTLLACNSAYLRIFGFNSEEEAYKCKLIDLYPTPQHYNDFLELLKSEEILEYHEIELRRFDKKPVYVITNMIGQFDQNGELTEIIGYFFDDTERKVLEQQFRQAQKMEAIGRLAGGVAHDFNNLLTIINGYSDLMLHRLSKNHPMNREIRQIKQAGDKATRLTNQLLAFSRRQVMQPRLLNLNTVVTDIDKILKRIIGEDIELIISLDPDLGTIKADPVQIEQVLMNLAVNARDAMPHGGMLSIETDMVDLKSDYNHKHLVIQPAGPYVRLSIIDTGMGMDEDTQSQIFEPFFTTKELGKGTGLGLSTVYGIVKQSNGYIWVDSKPEEGTTFQIYFPKVMDKAQQLEIEQKAKKTYGGNETILLVEDEIMVRELAAEILKEKGYKILESSRSEQALELSNQYKGKIQLMISDVVMPGMSGRELANLLKNARPDMKVLFISGYSDEVVLNQGNTEENFEFLQKPFVPDKFLECVRNILDQN